jgi:hypothetical protein
VSDRFFEKIDWQRPWLEHMRSAAMPIVEADDWRLALNQAARAMDLRNHRNLPIQFVAQSELPPGTAYEAFINATGCVPTRDNNHDFFNALVWLAFPKIKARLNALQSREIQQALASGDANKVLHHRGKLRDAATIFDENAAFLVTRNMELVDALRAHQWHKVFLTRRAEFEHDCEVRPFGHALMEKLVTPYKAVTAHAFIVGVSDPFFALSLQEKVGWIDTAVEQQIAGALSTSNFTPLPVLGVPSWHSEQNDAFYADSSVFRSKRST